MLTFKKKLSETKTAFGALVLALTTLPVSFGQPAVATPLEPNLEARSSQGPSPEAVRPFGQNGQTQTLGSFSLPELFGVSWPDQPIEFRYDGGRPNPATTRMIGPAGLEVAYQWVSSCADVSAVKGCLVVRSNLPAHANYTWTLQSGIAAVATAVHPVQISQVGPYIQVQNGLAGVRIINTTSNPRPWNMAPIQGIQLPVGGWAGSGASPNLLYSEPDIGWRGAAGAPLRTPMYTATNYEADVIDSGPLKVVIKATYTFTRPQYFYGQTTINTAGTGHYTFILTMYANSKSILIDEDSDMQFSYFLPLYSSFAPDQARYRGQDSMGSGGIDDPACGYETPANISGASNASPVVINAAVGISNGQRVLISGAQGNGAANGTFFARTAGYPNGQFALFQDAAMTRPVAGTGSYQGGGVAKPAYRGARVSPMADGFQDLTYSVDRSASYSCSTTTYRKLLTDYPAAAPAAGWYEELYRSGAGPGGPVVGIFAGRASRQQYSATGPSMPGVYTSNNHWISHKQDGGIQVDNLLRGPNAVTASLIHRNWGIFISTQADLLPTALHQPIADEQNSLTGINLSRLYTYQLAYPDPPGGWKWQYLSTSSANQLVSEVRNGTTLCGSTNCEYNLLYNSETSVFGRTLLDMWKGNSTSAVQTALNGALLLAQRIVQTLANGDNHFDGPLGYYQLGLSTSPETAVLNAILMDSNSTPAQKTTAKASLALYGCLLWDDDWFPIDNPSGESFGLANQVQQYLEYRTQSVAAAPSQPFLSSMVVPAATYPAADLNGYFSPTGAAAGSTHYQSAFFEPLILNYLNLAQNGLVSMTDPRWAAYANWELSIQTPPEPRFGNLRKGVSNGDGNTEADVRTGLLGTALYPINPSLAGNLMWAWQQSNSANQLTEDSQFGTTLTVIDGSIPAIVPSMASINIPGYHSVERHNFGTPHETALWFINGGFYSSGGHRHADDGQVSIYAHSAPLAIDWNANLYSPQTPGRFMHNSIVFDSELNHLWSADNAGLSDAENLFLNPTNTEFAAFSYSTTATGKFSMPDGTQWTRTVRTMNFNPLYPTIYVHDSFAGPAAITGKTLTWNVMATGPVQTTHAGTIAPVTRFSNGCQSPAGALPSNGTVFGLPAGLNEFSFTGATWPQHATHGIDWDIYTVSNTATQQFMIGNWGHGCHSSRETGEYRIANGVSFAESQHILRVHDSGPFSTIFLPHRKTEVSGHNVSLQPCGTQIVEGADTFCFNDSMSTYSNGTKGVLTVYDTSSQSGFGLTVSGGPQEVAIQGGKIVWTVAGNEAGPRSLTLQGSWFPNQPLARTGTTFSYTYSGGAQAQPFTVTFSQTP